MLIASVLLSSWLFLALALALAVDVDVDVDVASTLSVAPSTAKQVNATSYYNYPFAKYTLPECATQQVCNAVYTRLNRINSLCECPDKHKNSCSISFRNDDRHTIQLATDKSGKALTLVKTCEPINSVRQCKGPHDWAILALQNVRTGKSHYLVTCRCSANGLLEGPVAHENPPYAKIPGIRVFGMICKTTKSAHRKRISRSPLPIGKIKQFLASRKH